MEFTLRAIILGLLLSVVLAAANAYLGLKVGMTVSASIPAAVISFAVLRWFKQAHVRENNLVQTAASAGEALAAGMIFTIPALILFDAWQHVSYLQATLLITLGGLLGVLIAIPLRQALLDHRDLVFPEGLATAQVLRAGYERSSSVRFLVGGAVTAAVIKFMQTGLGVVASNWYGVTAIQRGVAGYGMDLSPALIAVGYIVGFRIAVLMFLGGVFVWLIVMPVYSMLMINETVPVTVAYTFQLWSEKLRFIGVGAMLVGGLWVLLVTLKPVWGAVYQAIRQSTHDHAQAFSMRTTFILMFVLAVPIGVVQYWMIEDGVLTLVSVVFALLASFLFSTVAAYMAGLVGSSNNPVSGVTIATIFIAAWLVYLLSGGADYLVQNETAQWRAAALTLFIGATVCCAAAISGDTMQDLKAGQILGAAPRYQTWMQLLGVIVAGVILIPILQLLYDAYGIAGHMPRDDMDTSQALAAPQASLMQSVTMGVFARQLEWGLISLGMVAGVIIIIIDNLLQRYATGLRLPVMAVAVGMYLPLGLTVPIFIGGLIHFVVNRRRRELSKTPVLYSSGLIAGEAIVGILLAIPFALWQSTSVLYLLENPQTGWLTLAGVVVIVYVCFQLWKVSSGER